MPVHYANDTRMEEVGVSERSKMVAGNQFLRMELTMQYWTFTRVQKPLFIIPTWGGGKAHW